MSEPAVSVIMPAYNASAFLRPAIESVLAQTFLDWELLVVDDGSTDDTWAIIESYTDPRIHGLKNAKKEGVGPASARNCALAAARSRCLAFLDSDDLWHPEKLEHQLTFMEQRDCGFSFTWFSIVDGEGQVIREEAPEVDNLSYRDFIQYPRIGCLSVMIDRDKLGDFRMPVPVGNYFYEDMATWMLLLKKEKAWCLRESLACYRRAEESISSNAFNRYTFYLRTMRKNNWCGAVGAVALAGIYFLRSKVLKR